MKHKFYKYYFKFYVGKSEFSSLLSKLFQPKISEKELTQLLEEIIEDPKPRSSKWLSSSVPERLWNTPAAKFSSAKYHTKTVLVSKNNKITLFYYYIQHLMLIIIACFLIYSFHIYYYIICIMLYILSFNLELMQSL